MNEKDYEIIEEELSISREEKSEANSVVHNTLLNGLHRSAILGRHGYRCITLGEVCVGDKDLIIKDQSNDVFNPIGLIDFICLNEKDEVIIGEVKTCLNYHGNYTIEQLFLKQDFARQMHIYGRLFEFMSKKAKFPINISHYLIIGLWEPSNAPKGFKSKIGLWKVKNNPKKWIEAIDSTPLSFNKIEFIERNQLETPRFSEVASISRSIVKDKDISLVYDRKSDSKYKYFLVDEKTKQVLNNFEKFPDAKEWIEASSDEEIKDLYTKTEKFLKLDDFY